MARLKKTFWRRNRLILIYMAVSYLSWLGFYLFDPDIRTAYAFGGLLLGLPTAVGAVFIITMEDIYRNPAK